MLLDIHTHHLPSCPETALLSYFPDSVPPPSTAVYLSAGLHPWYLSAATLSMQLEWLEYQLSDSRVIAIGETGLDKHCTTPLPLQEQAFQATIALSEQYCKPLIIHNVKATGEIMAIRKHIRPHQPWIVHGFRGKKELADSWLKQGCYLSFGVHYAPEALLSVPYGRLLLETDDSHEDIDRLYERAALLKGLSAEQLKAQTGQTIDSLFFNRY